MIKRIVEDLPRHATKRFAKRSDEPLGVAVHCTDMIASPEAIAKYDISLGNHIDPSGMPAISYHVFVDQDGSIYQTLDFDEVSWHAKGWNQALVSCVINYRASGNPNPPPQVQMDALVEAIARICLYLGFAPIEGRILGHRELEGTGFKMVNGKKTLLKECPGMKVDLTTLRLDVCRAVQKMLGVEDDGLWGPITQKAFNDFVPPENFADE